MLKKAMIMAAGVGSRLEPLTFEVPKPLVSLANTPVMDILVKHLVNSGITDIIMNTYYKAELIQEHYKNNNFGINIDFIREVELSGTAGGVRKCKDFFDKGADFIVLSGDGLTDTDINKAYESHKKSGSIATIVTKDVNHSEVSKYGIIVTDEEGFITGFQEKPDINQAKSNLANTGIYIFNYKIFDYIPENTFYDFAKDVFPALMQAGIKINTYKHTGYWSDIGSVEQYIKSSFDLINNKISHFSTNVNKTPYGKYIKGENSKVSNNAKIVGDCIIGSNCNIGENCIIKEAILWDNVIIKDNVIVENSIVMSGITVKKTVKKSIVQSEDIVIKEKILI